MKFAKLLCIASAIQLLGLLPTFATIYYLDADGGNDSNTGTSPGTAWATLAKAGGHTFMPGDQILLQSGDTFPGKLFLDGTSGTAVAPIVVDAYGEGARPLIDSAGYLAGIHLRDTAYVTVRNLEITADGGATVDGSDATLRYGLLIDTGSGGASSNTIQNLYIHDIFPELDSPHEGATPTTYVGTAIAILGSSGAPASDIRVEGCTIERTGFKAVEIKWGSYIDVLNNHMADIGGPAIQPGRSTDLVVRGNVVDGSGSFSDPRMHGRGSGIWPWTCERVLIEHNQFMHARGRADSCGIHIDFNCRDVVVQYNLSIDNAGGFIEILGNDSNCTYRYNISINDGHRTKGELTQGTLPNDQHGYIIFTSGYAGSGQPRVGPYNSYLYNNTIYVGSGQTGKFSIHESTDGLLIANNIFYIVDPTQDVTPDSLTDYTQGMIDRVVWTNNLYQRTGIIPPSFPFTDTAPSIADPLFDNTGGLLPEDYIPSNSTAVEDAGIVVDNIPGDPAGLAVGFEVSEDFFGNPVVGLPDMGAIETGGIPYPLPLAAFSSTPAYKETDSAVMTAVEGPYNTEYLFTEITGNYGGDDSGWQTDPTYVDTGLLPNTMYAYTVTLRDALDAEGSASTGEPVLIPEHQPVPSQTILSENFSGNPNPDNTESPYPSETWYIAYENEADAGSLNSDSGKLRLGWGYDRVMLLWYSNQAWNTGEDYTFSGDWEIANVLDVHLGIIAGVGEFDPVTGELLQRIKQVTTGELTSPSIGQTGTFSITVTSAELTSAGVGGTSRVGVFFEHDGNYTPLRNDVYLVDNLELQLPGSGPDADEDGIPDADETAAGMNPGNPEDADQDWDLDGFSNFAEYLTGSDLNDSNDFFRISFSVPADRSEITVPAANVLPGRLYILEHAATLGNSTTWTARDVFYGDFAGADTNQVFLHEAMDAQAFYRVRVERE